MEHKSNELIRKAFKMSRLHEIDINVITWGILD